MLSRLVSAFARRALPKKFNEAQKKTRDVNRDESLHVHLT